MAVGRLEAALEFAARLWRRGGEPAAIERRFAGNRRVVPQSAAEESDLRRVESQFLQLVPDLLQLRPAFG